MKLTRIAIVAGTMLILTGRRTSASRTGGSPETTSTTAPSAAATALAEAEARCRASGIDTYTIEYNPQCGECSNVALRLRVVAGKTADVEPLASARLTVSGEDPTVERLFDEIERALRDATADVTAVYDPNTGVPTTVSIDGLVDAIDDEGGWTVTVEEEKEAAQLAADLAAAREKWQALGLASYTIEYKQGCFCPICHVRMRVTDGVVDEVVPLENSTPPDVADAPTVEHLFDEVERATREATGPVTVEYDPTSGIPTTAQTDWIENGMDDELGWTVTLVTS